MDDEWLADTGKQLPELLLEDDELSPPPKAPPVGTFPDFGVGSPATSPELPLRPLWGQVRPDHITHPLPRVIFPFQLNDIVSAAAIVEQCTVAEDTEACLLLRNMSRTTKRSRNGRGKKGKADDVGEPATVDLEPVKASRKRLKLLDAAHAINLGRIDGMEKDRRATVKINAADNERVMDVATRALQEKERELEETRKELNRVNAKVQQDEEANQAIEDELAKARAKVVELAATKRAAELEVLSKLKAEAEARFKAMLEGTDEEEEEEEEAGNEPDAVEV